MENGIILLEYTIREVAKTINFHGNHFSAKFNFEGDRNIVTGCVGFGLERGISFLEQNNR